MWRLPVLSFLFLISPSFGASGGLCFVILAFPTYLYVYFVISYKVSSKETIINCQSLFFEQNKKNNVSVVVC